MTTSTPNRRVPDLRIRERRLQGMVEQAARLLGWTVYHTWNSQHSAPGFPDVVAVRPPRLLFAELKTERGKVSLAQAVWLEALRNCPGAEVHIWRPSDWPEIERALM